MAKYRKRVYRILGALIGGAVLAATPLAAAETNLLPVPTLTIYPGDLIREGMLVDRDFSANTALYKFGVIADHAALVGKVARRTLLPGAPIPGNAVMEPRLVVNGAKVRVVYEENGVVISTYAAALQPGSVGDTVSVRNLDSGLTISGVIQPDGSVRVSGG